MKSIIYEFDPVKYPKDKYPYKFGDKVRIIVLKEED